MRKSPFGEAHIIGKIKDQRSKIKEQEAGIPTTDVCRKQGFSQGTFYKFESRNGAMKVFDEAKERADTDECAKVKRSLDNTVP